MCTSWPQAWQTPGHRRPVGHVLLVGQRQGVDVGPQQRSSGPVPSPMSHTAAPVPVGRGVGCEAGHRRSRSATAAVVACSSQLSSGWGAGRRRKATSSSPCGRQELGRATSPLTPARSPGRRSQLARRAGRPRPAGRRPSAAAAACAGGCSCGRPARIPSTRASSSLAAELARHRAQSSASRSSTAARSGRVAPVVVDDELGVEAVAAGPPLVLAQHPVRWRRQRVAARRAAGRARPTRHWASAATAQHLRQGRDAVAHPQLDGAEVGVRADVPPHLADRADAPTDDTSVSMNRSNSAQFVERRGQPGGGQALEHLAAARRQPGVLALPVRARRRQRQQVRDVAGQGVGDGDRLLAASGRRRGRGRRRSAAAGPSTASRSMSWA